MTPTLPTTPTSKVLPASKTIAERSLVWAPAPPAETSFAGTLIVTQKKEKTVYRLDSTDADGMPGHAILLAKQLQLNRKGEPVAAHEVYRVYIGLNPEHTHCNCTGFGRWRTCKHVDAVKALFDLTRPVPDDANPTNPAGATDPAPATASATASLPVGSCNRCDDRGIVFDADAGYLPCESCQTHE